MKNYTKKSLKTSNGITLIALVITIIVLLILAGISISMLSGDNSILQKATDAKQTSERAEAKEQAQMDIMAYIADKTANHQDASLDDEKVKEILSDNKSYVKTAGDTSFITTKGEYEIPYSEIYTASDTPSIAALPAGTYTAGQEVTFGGEQFFVIGDDGDSVRLLAKYCLSKTENAQLDASATLSDYGRFFSSSESWMISVPSSWTIINDEYLTSHPFPQSENAENNAIIKAQNYGMSKGVTGRLLYQSDLPDRFYNLQGEIKDIFAGTWNDPQSSPSDGFLKYWIAEAEGDNVYYLWGDANGCYVSFDDDYGSNYRFNYGVRPVLIVPKS